MKWRAPSERIRTASEIPIEVNLTDEEAIPIYIKISEKVLHLRRLGMTYTCISERLGVNLWMAKRDARWGKGPLKPTTAIVIEPGGLQGPHSSLEIHSEMSSFKVISEQQDRLHKL